MNLQLMFDIAKLALSIADTHLEGKDHDARGRPEFCVSAGFDL